MGNYQYQIRDGGGETVTGVIQAGSMMEASDRLRAQGAFLLKILPIAQGPSGLWAKLNTGKPMLQMGPGLKDIQTFTNQLAVMIKAGISVRAAIEGIADQLENAKFKEIVNRIKADVESGQPFSAALARHPKVFSPLYINMVKASELSGNFGQMLDRISVYLSQQMETRSMVRGAMVYPSIIAVMAVGTTIFLLTFVLPKFTALFAGKDALLPKPTVILVAISTFMREYWYGLLAATVLGLWGFFYGIHTPVGRVWWDRCKLKLPLFKRMFRALYITRGLHTMSELVNAGVPVLETLSITAEVSGNALYRRLWNGVHDAVKRGEKIATPLERQTLLPRNVVQMISAGEESGKLAEVMHDIAEFYAKELRNTIKAVTAMIEPLMICVMGFVVGFIAMSIILPMFKLSALVK